MTCKHEHGDTLLGMWVCGQCYKKLHERPRTYRMERTTEPDGSDRRSLRQIVVHCPISTAECGVTLRMFVTWMVARLVVLTRGEMPHDEALDYSIGILEMLGDEFGGDATVWDRESAYEIVAEDMRYWDADECQSN